VIAVRSIPVLLTKSVKGGRSRASTFIHKPDISLLGGAAFFQPKKNTLLQLCSGCSCISYGTGGFIVPNEGANHEYYCK
jgi:hypothetical protein